MEYYYGNTKGPSKVKGDIQRTCFRLIFLLGYFCQVLYNDCIICKNCLSHILNSWCSHRYKRGGQAEVAGLGSEWVGCGGYWFLSRKFHLPAEYDQVNKFTATRTYSVNDIQYRSVISNLQATCQMIAKLESSYVRFLLWKKYCTVQYMFGNAMWNSTKYDAYWPVRVIQSK